jgi:hypothetical protein
LTQLHQRGLHALGATATDGHGVADGFGHLQQAT